MGRYTFKKYQDLALVGDKPRLDMTDNDYMSLIDYCRDRERFFSDLCLELIDKKAFMGKEVCIIDGQIS